MKAVLPTVLSISLSALFATSTFSAVSSVSATEANNDGVPPPTYAAANFRRTQNKHRRLAAEQQQKRSLDHHAAGIRHDHADIIEGKNQTKARGLPTADSNGRRSMAELRFPYGKEKVRGVKLYVKPKSIPIQAEVSTVAVDMLAKIVKQRVRDAMPNHQCRNRRVPVA